MSNEQIIKVLEAIMQYDVVNPNQRSAIAWAIAKLYKEMDSETSNN